MKLNDRDLLKERISSWMHHRFSHKPVFVYRHAEIDVAMLRVRWQKARSKRALPNGVIARLLFKQQLKEIWI